MTVGEKQRNKEAKRVVKERKAQEKALAKARKKEEKRRKEQQRGADAAEVQPVLATSQPKCLQRTQVREMVRLQLEIDGWDPASVDDGWIDELFTRFDADNSGTIDDAEWDRLIVAMRHAMHTQRETQTERHTERHTSWRPMDELQGSSSDAPRVAEPAVGAHLAGGRSLGQSPGKRLDRLQVREMVRLQLELDGWDTSGEHYVSDGWIDDLFNRFDADGSGTIDDVEWDLLVDAMRDGMDELQKRGGAEAQPLRVSQMTTYGTAGPDRARPEPQPNLAPDPAHEVAGATNSNADVVICRGCHFTMTWGVNDDKSYVCEVCNCGKTGERWVCQTCSRDQCADCNPGVNLPPRLVCRRRFHDFYIDRFEAESQEGIVQDFDEYHSDSQASASDTAEVRVHIHEAKELIPKDGSTSDPYVVAKCFGKKKQTSVAPAGIEGVFDEELQFVATQADLVGSMLTLECWDKDLLSDDLIGTFTFDLGQVWKREDKEYYKAWITLFNPQAQGEQGKLCVSVTILEPGDEMPARPGQEMSESGDTAEYELCVKVFHAEGLPRMDSGKNDLANPCISLVWANQQAETKVARSTLSPEWNEELIIRVLVEQSVNAPPRSDVVLVRLRERDKSLVSIHGMQEISHAFLFLSDIQNAQWEHPCWLNFYGAVRPYDDPVLRKPAKSSKHAKSSAAMMNTGKTPGLMYRGRVLLSATMRRSISDSVSRRAANQPAMAPPANTWYNLKVAVVDGCDLPHCTALAVRVTWGLPKSGQAGTEVGLRRNLDAAGWDALTQPESSAGGVAQWDRLLSIRGEWPADLTQVPDVVVELIDLEENKRMYCLRIDLRHPFIRSPKQMVPQRRFGAPTLQADWFDLQVDSEYVLENDFCEPQLLLSFGVECGRAPANRAVKCPHVRDILAMTSTDEHPVAIAEDEYSWWAVDDLLRIKDGADRKPGIERLQRDLAVSTKLGSRSLDELRAQALAEGVGPARMQDAARFVDHLGRPLDDNIRSLHNTAEGAALAYLLKQRLADSAQCQARIRCHVYQARGLEAGFNSDEAELYVTARLWDADGRGHVAQSKTVGTPSRSAQWFETLEINDVTIPGPNTQSIQVRMAADMVVAVYQMSKGQKRAKGQKQLKTKDGASMIGRLRVRLSTMEARFEEPMWYPLRVPGTGVRAGEILVGFQLTSSDIPCVPRIITPAEKPFDLEVTIIGARCLRDTAAVLMTGVNKSLVKWECNEHEGKTRLADGKHPNYFHPETLGEKQCYTTLVEGVGLPIDGLYAPSITFSVHTKGTLHLRILLSIATGDEVVICPFCASGLQMHVVRSDSIPANS